MHDLQHAITAFPRIPEPPQSQPHVLTSLPEAGAFVIFGYHHTQAGVVLRPPASLFNELHNKLTVLTLGNTIEEVAPPAVSLHVADLVDVDGILDQRHDLDFGPRQRALAAGALFVSDSLAQAQSLGDSMQILYAQYAQHQRIRPIAMDQVWGSIPPPDSPYLRLVHHAGVHLHMINDPAHWLVSGCFETPTSNIARGYSNSLPRETTYFANSIVNKDAVAAFLRASKSPDAISQYKHVLNHLKTLDKDAISAYLTIWEGRKYMHLVDALKFATVYPHPRLMDAVKNLGGGTVFDLLERLQIYDNPQNPMSDIVASASLIGTPDHPVAAVSAISSTQAQSSLMRKNREWVDHLPHLRQAKRYYRDHVIYALPGLAVSLEKINLRKYKLNVHVPDVAAYLAPGLRLFHQLMTDELVGYDIFDESVKDFHRFKDQHLESNVFGTGDVETRAPFDATCMTVSYEYNTFELRPFSSMLGRVAVSFDYIGEVKVKTVLWEQLEDLLSGKAHLLPFKLFSRKQEQPKFDDWDRHNLNFIYSVLQSHFKARHHLGALTVDAYHDPNSPETICKEVKEVEDRVVTKLERPDPRLTATARFFVAETQMFVSRCVASFGEDHDVPLVSTAHGLLHTESDEVLVSHNNLLLPEYETTSYFQTLLLRDSKGYVSLAAHIIGRNYLQPPRLTLQGANVLSGLDSLTNIWDTFHRVDALLNQLQLLNTVQLHHYNRLMRSSTRPLRHIELVQRFSYLKSLGYNVHGPNPESVISRRLTTLNNSVALHRFVHERQKSYWTLRFLEQRLLELQFTEGQPDFTGSGTRYTCVVTGSGERLEQLGLIYRAFCPQLGVEVSVLAGDEKHVGSVLECNKVLYVDAAAGQCVLQESVGL